MTTVRSCEAGFLVPSRTGELVRRWCLAGSGHLDDGDIARLNVALAFVMGLAD
jgi:hypothetical protein